MDKIPTAEDILIKNHILLKSIEESGNFPLNLTRDTHITSAYHIRNSMVEFAKLHVKIALEDIFERAKHGDQEHQDWLKKFFDSYPLDNIK